MLNLETNRKSDRKSKSIFSACLRATIFICIVSFSIKYFWCVFFLFLKLSTTDTESLWRVLCYRCLPCAKTSPMCVNEAKHFECSLALVVSFSSTFFFVHVFVHMFYTKPKSIDRHWIWATARFSLFSIGVQRFRLSLFCIRGRRRQSMCISLSD